MNKFSPEKTSRYLIIKVEAFPVWGQKQLMSNRTIGCRYNRFVFTYICKYISIIMIINNFVRSKLRLMTKKQ